MPRKVSADRTLFGVTVVLAAIGVVMVGSASSYYSLSQSGGIFSSFMVRQIVYATAGLLLMYRLMRTDYHFFARPQVVFGLVGGTTLLLMLVFLFSAHKGTHRWIPMGFFSVQPSELAKFALAVFLAHMADKKGEQINSPSVGTVPCFAVAGLLAGLVLFEPDMGTAVVLLLVTTLVLFSAGLRWKYVLGTAGAGAALLPVMILLEPYRLKRIFAFLHPEENLQGANFQLFQSKIALGSGGVFGSGLALGQQKWLFLPESHTDFIFSVVGEELGMIGTSILLILFLVFFWRGARASLRAPDRFGTYLALGITLFLVCQAFLNMGVASGMLPTKGLPLPFVSYGGSALIVSLGMTGVLLNVSQQGS